MRVRQHQVTLRGERVFLRALTEDDWAVLLKWNNDPDVLHFSEGDEVSGYSLEGVQELYRAISRHALCFIVEVEGNPVGECWLQRMNLERILTRYLGRDCRRIDLMIGEKALWGRGLGTEVIRLLAAFGFEEERADLIFGCDIAEDNLASLRAFEKAGFWIDTWMPQPFGARVRRRCDVVLSRERYLAHKRPP